MTGFQATEGINGQIYELDAIDFVSDLVSDLGCINAFMQEQSKAQAIYGQTIIITYIEKSKSYLYSNEK